MYSTKSKNTEPRSYREIYHHLEQILDDCSTFITNAEIDYYQGSPLETSTNQITSRPLSVIVLQTWSRQLNDLRQQPILSAIRNNATVRELLTDARENESNRPISEESIDLLERIFHKTNQQLDLKIPILINKILDCMNLMERYFLSFYEIKDVQYTVQNKKQEEIPDEYVEAPYAYEKSRWSHMFEVNTCLKTLRELSQRIYDDENGVALSALSKDCQRLAFRCNCTLFPYILILPECYNEARRAVSSLRTWLSEDKNYTEFIGQSLKSLNKKYLQVQKTFEMSKSHLSQIKYRVESHRCRLDKLQREKEIHEEKYQDFEQRFNLKEKEYSAKCLTCQVYVRNLHKLYEQSMDAENKLTNQVLMKTLQEDIEQFSQDLPKLKSQVDTLQARVHCFQEQTRNVIKMQNENQSMNQELLLVLEEKNRQENHFHRIEKCRDVLRNIYKCRKQNDLIEKIFYDLPIATKQNGTNKEDVLSKTFYIISKSIGRDWNRLYGQLLFHPKRGQELRSEDLKHIDEKYPRGNVFQNQAMDALKKWRRFHTRAKIDDLINGLQQIHRFDIIKLIHQDIIKPKPVLDIDHEEIDLEKKEIEELNEKLIRLFEKIRNDTFLSDETNT